MTDFYRLSELIQALNSGATKEREDLRGILERYKATSPPNFSGISVEVFPALVNAIVVWHNKPRPSNAEAVQNFVEFLR